MQQKKSLKSSSMKAKINSLAWWVVTALIAILPFHAFLYTYLHSFFWNAEWMIFAQAWKEILVGILGILAMINWWKNWKFPKQRGWWLGLIFVFLGILYAAFGNGEITQRVLGLRSLIIFVVAFLAIPFFEFSETKKDSLKRIAIASASIVVGFALLQKFFLPQDFLANFGYSRNVSSWLPGGNLPMFHLIGESGMRLQSTLSGPNQLAAYLTVILPIAWLILFGEKRKFWQMFATFTIIGGVATIFWSFSRSAWVGLFVVGLMVAIFAWRKNLSRKLRKHLLLGGIIAVIAGISAIIFQPNFQQIITREASTSAHLTRSVAAAKLVLRNPLGLGLGKTAGISQRFDAENHDGITPENTYLGIALEVGWLGGMLFIALFASLLIELRKTKSPLFYSLLGIAVIAFFLHPLEDSATALTLFLLIGEEI
jgi:O-antigen ligase